MKKSLLEVLADVAPSLCIMMLFLELIITTLSRSWLSLFLILPTLFVLILAIERRGKVKRNELG